MDPGWTPHRELTETRCSRGAQIARQLRLSEDVADAAEEALRILRAGIGTSVDGECVAALVQSLGRLGEPSVFGAL